MASAKVIVTNESGLHLRPATVFSKLCASMNCDITLIAGDKKVNPKSVLMLMSAGVSKGMEVEIITKGEDEEANLQKLIEALNSGLGEDEA